MTSQLHQVSNFTAPRELAALAADSEKKWLIQNRFEEGLNIHYHLCLVRPYGRDYEIKLPWKAQKTCHSCQGQGLVYVWRHVGLIYEAELCGECRGEGCQSYDSEISLVISDSLAERQVIIKSRAGRLNARLGLRGDLIVTLNWVDSLSDLEDMADIQSAPTVN